MDGGDVSVLAVANEFVVDEDEGLGDLISGMGGRLVGPEEGRDVGSEREVTGVGIEEEADVGIVVELTVEGDEDEAVSTNPGSRFDPFSPDPREILVLVLPLSPSTSPSFTGFFCSKSFSNFLPFPPVGLLSGLFPFAFPLPPGLSIPPPPPPDKSIPLPQVGHTCLFKSKEPSPSLGLEGEGLAVRRGVKRVVFEGDWR